MNKLRDFLLFVNLMITGIVLIPSIPISLIALFTVSVFGPSSPEKTKAYLIIFAFIFFIIPMWIKSVIISSRGLKREELSRNNAIIVLFSLITSASVLAFWINQI